MTLQQLSSGAVLIIVVVAFAFWRPPLYASAVLVGLAASLVIAIGLSMSILAYIRKLRSRAFGIVAGPHRRGHATLDVMAGVPSRRWTSPWCRG